MESYKYWASKFILQTSAWQCKQRTQQRSKHSNCAWNKPFTSDFACSKCEVSNVSDTTWTLAQTNLSNLDKIWKQGRITDHRNPAASILINVLATKSLSHESQSECVVFTSCPCPQVLSSPAPRPEPELLPAMAKFIRNQVKPLHAMNADDTKYIHSMVYIHC